LGVVDMDLQEELSTRMNGQVVIVGIGNPVRGDDAAGSLVARQIRPAPGVHVIDALDVPENHLHPVINQRPDAVFLIDAVDLHSAPGSVALLEQGQMAAYWPNTHRVPMRILMDYLARQIHAPIWVLAIQPRETDFMGPVSEDVRSSVTRLADLLNALLETRRIPVPDGNTGPPRKEVPA
jgi:hydrogenase 3 maturation protease